MLDVGYNSIGADGMIALSNALLLQKTLTRLSVAGILVMAY